jgi:cytochrome c-type biogenesis protein CcmF
VTIAGIAGMSLASNTIVALRPGQSTQLAGYEWKLDDLHDGKGSNYAARVADVTVSRNGHLVAQLAPSRKFFALQQQTTSDVAIQTNLLADIYVVLGEEQNGAAVLRLHYNLLAPWIWLGGLVMALGGALSLSDRRLRVGAPVRRTVAVPAE